ncbi:uncharacterized protein V6R79_013942 [Siganus canaliculatus]
MNDHFSFSSIDGLLFQFVCRAGIAEKKSYIETMCRNTKKLEEEIEVKQSTMMHSQAKMESMRASNSLLQQYEQSLKEELESKKSSYNHDKEVYEDRIESYKKIFQKHKERYYENPVAQKLLMLQAEKEEIELRIKACDDQMSTSILSVSAEQSAPEPEHLAPHTEQESDSSTDVFSLHLSQTENNPYMSANDEEIGGSRTNQVQDSAACGPAEGDSDLWSHQQMDEQICCDGMLTEEDEGPRPEDQLMEQQVCDSETQEAEEHEEMEEREAAEDEEVLNTEDNMGAAAFSPSSSQEMNPEASPVKPMPSTPVFPFNFGLGSSPQQEDSDTKSPAFHFTVNSGPSTPGFSGFQFDEAASQEEDSSFAFTGSFFSQKKTTESKSAGCPEFLFGQSEQNEDFQFAFTSKSSQTAAKDNTEDPFPFSFNF